MIYTITKCKKRLTIKKNIVKNVYCKINYLVYYFIFIPVIIFIILK